MKKARNDGSECVGSVPLREYQLFQLSILKEFVRICEKHHLTYWIAYGSLLGAARHEGFIPWDDDIDVLMPPSDYRRFREACEESLGDGFYLQVHCKNPQNYIEWQRIGVKNSTSMVRAHADIHGEWGVCMDVFPLCPCPDPLPKAFLRDFKAKMKTLVRISRKYLYLHDAKSLTGIKKLYHLYRGVGTNRSNIKEWLAAEDAVLGTEEDYQNAKQLIDVDFVFYEKKWFEESIELPFEGMLLKAPVGYKEILSHYYGSDWMKLPPREKRVYHSGGGSEEVLVSLTEPYTRFLV